MANLLQIGSSIRVINWNRKERFHEETIIKETKKSFITNKGHRLSKCDTWDEENKARQSSCYEVYNGKLYKFRLAHKIY